MSVTITMHRPLLPVFLKLLFVCILPFALISCATGGTTVVNHVFSFDTNRDSPDVQVLDYQYGDCKEFGTCANKYRVAEGKVFNAWTGGGLMPRGDFLYVKWRIKQTGQLFEDRVNLKDRLPDDITDCRIHFVIRGSQLYVYLISPERRPASIPAGPVKLYKHLKQYQIYPDQPK